MKLQKTAFLHTNSIIFKKYKNNQISFAILSPPTMSDISASLRLDVASRAAACWLCLDR